VANQNITVSLSEDDIRAARILAANHGTSMSQLLAQMLTDLVGQESGCARARGRSLARLREEMGPRGESIPATTRHNRG
jgi:plasmid stability protein